MFNDIYAGTADRGSNTVDIDNKEDKGSNADSVDNADNAGNVDSVVCAPVVDRFLTLHDLNKFHKIRLIQTCSSSFQIKFTSLIYVHVSRLLVDRCLIFLI